MRTDEAGHVCPETLGEYRDLVAALMQGRGRAVDFLDKKIAESPNGGDEKVVAPDSQVRFLLFGMMREDLADTMREEVEETSGEVHQEVVDGFKVKLFWRYSVIACRCGSEFRWEGFDDRLDAWKAEHAPHR